MAHTVHKRIAHPSKLRLQNHPSDIPRCARWPVAGLHVMGTSRGTLKKRLRRRKPHLQSPAPQQTHHRTATAGNGEKQNRTAPARRRRRSTDLPLRRGHKQRNCHTSRKRRRVSAGKRDKRRNNKPKRRSPQLLQAELLPNRQPNHHDRIPKQTNRSPRLNHRHTPLPQNTKRQHRRRHSNRS